MDKPVKYQPSLDRVVGWGKVPKEYSELENKENEQEDKSVDEDTKD
mgnify:CR=1 FL=1